jgi:Mn-containing catalase
MALMRQELPGIAGMVPENHVGEGRRMFFHVKELQYQAKPAAPDPLFASRLQEVLGGQWGEMSVMMTYLFQGWNCRGPAKYKDLLLGTGTEEIAHVEMLATMISRLLEGAPISLQESMVAQNPAVAAVMGGMNPQAAIVAGLGATPNDSMGVPWNSRYTVASGNMLADFRFNVAAESQGRLQVARLYNMTEDAGVRDMFSFMLARDTMHQNQWLAAIEELAADGLEQTPVPSSFPRDREMGEVAYQFMNASDGTESQEGRWAKGPSIDGHGEFTWVKAKPFGENPGVLPADPRLFGTPDPSQDGLVERVVNRVTS